ncbi:hypothetical protein D9758_008646 [Tetrapyrgos nigripes]|uniref:Uncharacterized protein n=1 Tax=Tetrapyrgos nigripes TaxID=182062 RepID=A0A8H5D4W7_9AGAR|nr:hypothetical protein D9758_008646 [Tetrapyrgos nigripes]
MLIGLGGFIIALNVRGPINCQALYVVLSVMGHTALGAASVNLGIRTKAIWGQNCYVNAGLILFFLGQFGIIVRSMFNVKGIVFVPGAGCALVKIDSTIFAAMYIYTMSTDLIIVILTAIKLIIQPRKNMALASRSGMVKLLFKDGLFSCQWLHSFVISLRCVPATTFATIMACRVVRRLHYHIQGTEVYAAGSDPAATTMHGRTGAATIPVYTNNTQPDGVHIQVNTYSIMPNISGLIFQCFILFFQMQTWTHQDAATDNSHALATTTGKPGSVRTFI